MVKTRIAPTPSGYLHLGNILSFALTAAIAMREQGSILLRIDDLDQQRTNDLYIQDIFDTLNFLELPWHEGPRNIQELQTEWSQIHRMQLYQQALQHLQQSGQVFACTCSRSTILSSINQERYLCSCFAKRISLASTHVSWRLATDDDCTLKIKNWPADITPAILPGSMHQFVVRKKDGYPAYQLSSVIDDLHFGITHVVRGVDLWPSTLAQHYLAGVLSAQSFKQIKFHHHALLVDVNSQKLSKSAGAASVRYLREQGLKKEDVYQHIAMLLQIKQPVTTWQQLAEAVWANQ
jgi:glutamyl/glutaminyl-tRNA synthetase